MQDEPTWNVVATAQTLQLAPLRRLLRRFGRFRNAPFQGVLLGEVEDPAHLCEQLRIIEEHDPGFLDPLARLVPVAHVFRFETEELPERLREVVRPYAEAVGGGRFYVRVERRGHKGELHSQPIEQMLDAFLQELVREQGGEAEVDFKDPDVIVVVELVGDVCGVGILPRDLRERYPFVRVH